MLMLKAYAKINLGLNIVNRDPQDGYHNLDMVIVPIELHDRIEIELLPYGFDTLITSDDCELPTDETNIVSKVERALRAKYGYTEQLRIHIHKKIPMGAGLGGGSADGAAVLIGLNKLLKLKMSEEEMCRIGYKIGSDIPFCLKNCAARVQGKGEVLTSVKVRRPFGVLIVFPKTGLSTGKIYSEFDLTGASSPADISGIIEALEKDDLSLLSHSMGNELEKTAVRFCPSIEAIKEKMKEEGLTNALMTGSGSAVFSLSHDLKLLKKAADRLEGLGYKVILSQTR